jgi:hypothetical protein
VNDATIAETQQMALDGLMTGSTYMDAKTGRRIPPEAVALGSVVDLMGGSDRETGLTDTEADTLFEMVADPAVRQGQLDDLAEAIADMLDHALHPDECWISPTETNCTCLIGDIRAALPQCTYVKPGLSPQTRSDHWRCLRTVHPSTPDRHYYGGEELPVTTITVDLTPNPKTAVRIAEAFGIPPRMIGPEVQDEALRELLSRWRASAVEMRRLAEDGTAATLENVAAELAKILDGED